MNICVSVLPLIIGVILQFGVSTSNRLLGYPRSQPITPVKPLKLSFIRGTGQLYAIEYDGHLYEMKKMKFTEKVNKLAVDSLLYRRGPKGGYIGRLTAKGFIDRLAPKHANGYNQKISNYMIRQKPGDIVFDPSGATPIGIFRYNEFGTLLSLYRFNFNGGNRIKLH